MSEIFISHAEEDEAVAVELAQGLEAAGYTTWYFERDGLPGVSYLEQIDEAIEQCHSMLIVISTDSISSSQIDKEVERAHESRKHFIPVLRGIQHAEFQNRKRGWRMAMGAVTSLSIPVEGASSIIRRIIAGLKKLGLEPKLSTTPAGEVDFEQLLDEFEREQAIIEEREIFRGRVVGLGEDGEPKW